MRQSIEPWLTPARRVFWRAAQAAFIVFGAVILAALFFAPKTGLHLLWNVLIPVAPLLLVLAPGVWRNVCPVGTASMLPQHFRLSRRIRVSRKWQGRLLAVAVLLLLLIVPLRPVMLDSSGLITGSVLLAVALLAGVLGFFFDSRSAWCSGICPVYPVEMLYGSKPATTVRNAQCRVCSDCVEPCRDSKKAVVPTDAAENGPGRWAALLLIGGFPGFIIGWYQLPTWQPAEGLRHIGQAYAYTLGGMAISLAIFLIVLNAYPEARRAVGLMFAAAAVSAYYWFKLPVMLGLGEPSAALLPLGELLPAWSAWPLRGAAILFFGWMLLRKARATSWSLRPPRTA
jgi:hypothetical protein